MTSALAFGQPSDGLNILVYCAGAWVRHSRERSLVKWGFASCLKEGTDRVPAFAARNRALPKAGLQQTDSGSLNVVVGGLCLFVLQSLLEEVEC